MKSVSLELCHDYKWQMSFFLNLFSEKHDAIKGKGSRKKVWNFTTFGFDYSGNICLIHWFKVNACIWHYDNILKIVRLQILWQKWLLLFSFLFVKPWIRSFYNDKQKQCYINIDVETRDDWISTHSYWKEVVVFYSY